MNFIINDLYSKLDYALALDGKGIMTPLKYGGLGEDLTAFSALLGIASGIAIAAAPLNATGALLDDAALNATKTAHGFLPKLSDNVTQYLSGKGTWVNPVVSAWPVGSVFISVVATNPATLLGFGTWVAFGSGKVLVGIDGADADFDTVEETGGSKTHTHAVDVGSTVSGAPSATVNAVIAAGVTAVGDGTHTHSADPASVTSGAASNVPPYIVCYFWKRVS